jgi:CheY-like chemotaxis protein/DNA-binding Xre family transcriptional regulator
MPLTDGVVARVDLKRRFGTTVREWRGRRGISQEELAERAGLHRTYVSDIERGARNVSLESIEKLASALEVSVSTLFVSKTDECGESVFPEEMVNILLVEDNADDAHLTVRALEQARIANRLSLVRDGVSALQYIFGVGSKPSTPLKECPHLILLDLNLPKIDGLEVLRRLKADPRTRSIPVIVLTVSRHDADIRTSKKLGADGYIVKPVGFQNLSEVTPQLSLQWALLKSAKSERD